MSALLCFLGMCWLVLSPVNAPPLAMKPTTRLVCVIGAVIYLAVWYVLGHPLIPSGGVS